MAEVNKSSISLRISGSALKVEYVTELMGAPPHRAYEKGGPHVLPNGKVRIGHTGYWSRKVERQSPSDLDSQVAELLGPLSPNLKVWDTLSSQFHIDLFCGLFLEHSNEGFSLKPETLLALALRGIELEFDIYSGKDSDDEEEWFDMPKVMND